MARRVICQRLTTITRQLQRQPVSSAAQRCLSSSTASSQPIYMAGIGVAPVTRRQDKGLAALVKEAVSDMRSRHPDLDLNAVQGVFVGNMLSGILSNQQHMGPLVVDAAGLSHTACEAVTAEACCGAGGAALRLAYMALASGEVETALVVGVEQMTHAPTETVTHGLATASHWPTEGAKGMTFVSLNGVLMDAYMKRYNVPHSAFYPFAKAAHDNAATSPHAVFKNKPLDFDQFENAAVLDGPIQLFDAPPTCDGAAAVLVTRNESLARAAQAQGSNLVRIASSAAATDILAVAQRENPLHLRGVEVSAKQALSKAGVTQSDIDIFELHDAYTSMACLCLENAGFVEPGEGIEFAQQGNIRLDGRLPISTFGGLKARGHPVGATGVYQAAEMFMQLTDQAGPNQVANANTVLIQSIGGAGASVFAHVLERS